MSRPGPGRLVCLIAPADALSYEAELIVLAFVLLLGRLVAARPQRHTG